jgi:hypothetical protein
VFEVLHIGLVSGIVKVLKDTSDKFVLANFEGSLSEGRGVGVRTKLDHEAGGLKVTEVGGDMQRRVEVGVLTVEDLL